MRVVVNGTPTELREGALVTDAVAALRPDNEGRGIAVAVNGAVIPKSEWARVELAPEDSVEVLTAVAGG
ncbi:MAG: sulfur carrier protein ThiS [Actinobacteria bacterium]|nr:sulfur carrier protein ThiS [Actinomycetota bacterium]